MTTKEPPLLADLLTLAKEHSLAVEACDLKGSTAPAGMRLVVVAALPTSITLQDEALLFDLLLTGLKAQNPKSCTISWKLARNHNLIHQRWVCISIIAEHL